MVVTVNELIVMWVAAILGLLLAVIVVSFVFSPRFRRDVLRSSNNELVASASSVNPNCTRGDTEQPTAQPLNRSSTFSVTAKGSMVALVTAFLLALVALVALPRLSTSKLATPEQVNSLATEEERSQRELAASMRANETLAQAAARAKSVKLEAFYIGEFARGSFGRQFPCGTDPTTAAKDTCGSDTPISIKAVSSHAGNRCGYAYFSVACAPQ